MPPSYNTTAPFNVLKPAAIDQIVGRQAVQCSSVASLAFLVWDMLITVDDEVKVIWSKPWGVIKSLYFFLRYFPFLVQICNLFVGTSVSTSFHYTRHDCYIWEIFVGFAFIAIVGAVDVILVLRVIALYHGNLILRNILTALYVLELAIMGVSLGLAVPNIEYNEICLVIGAPHTLFLYGAAIISFQIILIALTVTKFFEALRSGWGDVPLIVLLVRDGTWAFILLSAAYLGQASLYALDNHALFGLLYGWLLTTLSFSGYRIILNLNHISPSERQTSGMNRTNTDMQFTTQISSDIILDYHSNNSFEL